MTYEDHNLPNLAIATGGRTLPGELTDVSG